MIYIFINLVVTNSKAVDRVDNFNFCFIFAIFVAKKVGKNGDKNERFR